MPFTREQVWQAVKSMKLYKFPGLDGFQAVFYHKYWHVVREMVFNTVQKAFLSSYTRLSSDITETTFVLIPKDKNPKTI